MRCTTASLASHSRAAFSAMASNTDWRSDGELAIMRRISLVAASRASDSSRSRLRSLFSWINFAKDFRGARRRGFAYDFLVPFLVVEAIKNDRDGEVRRRANSP